MFSVLSCLRVSVLLPFIVWAAITAALGSFASSAPGAPRPAGGDLFARLDLDRTGLEAVRDAVRHRDNHRAERELLDYFRRRRSPRWFPERAPEPGARQPVLGRAQAVLAHDFTFLNRRARLGSRIDWHANPAGDREWTWSLNRHGYFDDLVAAYRLTGDARYARELDALLADWIRTNPAPDHPDDSSDAWRAVEAGSRMSGPWIRAWNALQESASFRPETRLAMLRSLAEHADYLERFPSSHSEQAAPASPGRAHPELGTARPAAPTPGPSPDCGGGGMRRLVGSPPLQSGEGPGVGAGRAPRHDLDALALSASRPVASPDATGALQEANGLAHVGVFFPEFKDAATWRRAAVERLEAEMRRQVYPDGGQFELSTLYQQVALRSFAEPLRLLALDASLSFSDAYLDGITRMLRWNMALARPDHSLPQLNDADRVAVTRLPSFFEDLAGVASPRLQAALARWRALDFTDRSLALPDSGLFVMRGDSRQAGDGSRQSDNERSPSLPSSVSRLPSSSDARYLCIDAGPFGAGHPHEDKLGLDLYAFGRSLLIDPGCYSSTTEGAWFRGPAAHNTVLVDGQGQNRRGTASDRWVVTIPSSENRWFSAAGIDGFEGVYNDGYGPNNDRAVKHVRQVLFVKPSYWVVWDRLAPDAGEARLHRFDQLWHFPPGRTQVDDARRLVATADEDRANLALLPLSTDATHRVVEGGGTRSAPETRARTATAGAELFQGWYSPEYGVREPAPVAVYTREAVPPVLFETVLFPYAAGPRPVFDAERVPVTSDDKAAAPAAVSALRFHYGRLTDLILMAHDPRHAAALKQAGDLRTDAEALVLRLDVDGHPIRLMARGVSTAVYAGRVLFASEKPRDTVDVEVTGEKW